MGIMHRGLVDAVPQCCSLHGYRRAILLTTLLRTTFLLTEQLLAGDSGLGRVRISTLHNETEKFSSLNSNTYKGAFLCLVTYSHLP